MRTPLLSMLAGLLAIGCSGSELRTIDLNAASGVIVLVVLDSNGAPVRALPPFGLERGRLTFGEAPRLALQGNEASTVRLQIDPAALKQTLPRLDLTRLSLWQVSVEPPPSEPIYDPRVRADGVHTTLSLPSEGLQIFDEQGQPVQRETLDAQLSLQLWLDPQGCAEPGRTGLTAYGASQQPFAEALLGTRYAGVLAIAPIDPTHVLISGGGVGVLTRNQPFIADAQHWLSPEDLKALGFDGARVSDISLGPDSASPRQAYIAVQHTQGGALLELSVQSDRLSYVRTATITDVPLYRVDRKDDGQIAALGDQGLVLLMAAEGGPLRRLSLPGLAYTGASKTHLSWTGSAEEPLVANSETSMHGLDATQTTWSTSNFNSLGFGVRFRGMARRGDEIWVASNANTLFRRTQPQVYELINPRPSPGAGACGTADTSAFPSIFRHIDVVAADAQSIFIAYDNCAIPLRLRADDLCASTIDLAASGVAVVDWSYTSAETYQGSVLFGTSFGDLWISEVIE